MTYGAERRGTGDQRRWTVPRIWGTVLAVSGKYKLAIPQPDTVTDYANYAVARVV